MTYLDAAYTILKTAGQPLHFEEITQRALAQKLIAPQGLTPEATMGSRLYTDTKQEGSLFVRAGKGVFGLAQWQPKGIDAHIAEINTATRKQWTQLVLASAGWGVQDRGRADLGASVKVAVREFPLTTGEVGYLPVVNRKASGGVEAKPEGATLSGVEMQSGSR